MPLDPEKLPDIQRQILVALNATHQPLTAQSIAGRVRQLYLPTTAPSQTEINEALDSLIDGGHVRHRQPGPHLPGRHTISAKTRAALLSRRRSASSKPNSATSK